MFGLFIFYITPKGLLEHTEGFSHFWMIVNGWVLFMREASQLKQFRFSMGKESKHPGPWHPSEHKKTDLKPSGTNPEATWGKDSALLVGASQRPLLLLLSVSGQSFREKGALPQFISSCHTNTGVLEEKRIKSHKCLSRMKNAVQVAS